MRRVPRSSPAEVLTWRKPTAAQRAVHTSPTLVSESGGHGDPRGRAPSIPVVINSLPQVTVGGLGPVANRDSRMGRQPRSESSMFMRQLWTSANTPPKTPMAIAIVTPAPSTAGVIMRS